MKKLLTFTAVALAFSMTPALADHHGEKGNKAEKGGKMFQRHDANGDGVVSKAEFLSHAEEKFGKMDADGNGELSQEEAKAAHGAMREKRQENREERKEKRESASESSGE